jgi:putative transposase
LLNEISGVEAPGYACFLKKYGLVINHKRTEQIYNEQGLSLRKRSEKNHLLSFRIPRPEASRPNDIWSIDFMSDADGEGNLFRILTMVDDFSRLSPGVLAKRPITGKVVTEFIDRMSRVYGYPKRIRVDNGPEFSSRVFHQWALTRGILI